MVIDYKNIGFSFKDKKIKKRLKRLKFISIIIALLMIFFLIYHIQQVNKIKKIQSLLLDNQKEDALKICDNMSNSLLHKKTICELRALIYFFYGETGKATEMLKRVKKPVRISEMPWQLRQSATLCFLRQKTDAGKISGFKE